MNRIESMLGLAAKAGKLQSGSFLTENAVRGGKARLVLIACDAEKNTRKALEDKCSSHHVPVRHYGTKERLGACIGKEYRSCVAVTDTGFAGKIIQMMDEDAAE